MLPGYRRSLARVPAITYQDEPGYGSSDIFFRRWRQDKSGRFIGYKDEQADIDFLPYSEEPLNEQIIPAGKELNICKHITPFSIHGNKGPGKYRIQAF